MFGESFLNSTNNKMGAQMLVPCPRGSGDGKQKVRRCQNRDPAKGVFCFWLPFKPTPKNVASLSKKAAPFPCWVLRESRGFWE